MQMELLLFLHKKYYFFLQNKDISFSDEENIKKIQKKKILMIKIMKKTI